MKVHPRGWRLAPSRCARRGRDRHFAGAQRRTVAMQRGGQGRVLAVTATRSSMSRTAALAHTEGGKGDAEVGDEESYYEVWVILMDGRRVDVRLDGQFSVVGDEVEDGREDD